MRVIHKLTYVPVTLLLLLFHDESQLKLETISKKKMKRQNVLSFKSYIRVVHSTTVMQFYIIDTADDGGIHLAWKMWMTSVCHLDFTYWWLWHGSCWNACQCWNAIEKRGTMELNLWLDSTHEIVTYRLWTFLTKLVYSISQGIRPHQTVAGYLHRWCVHFWNVCPRVPPSHLT